MQPMIRPKTIHPPLDRGNNIDAGILSAKAYCIAIPPLFRRPYNKANNMGYGLIISLIPLSFHNNDMDKDTRDITANHIYI